MYTRNKTWYTFFFTLSNEKDKSNIKQHFFAIRKTIKEVEELGLDNNDAIITMEKIVNVFSANKYDLPTEKDNLTAYTESMSFKDLIERQKKDS